MSHRGLRYARFGQPEEVLELARLETAVPPPGNIQVQMRLAPVNPSDLIPITGAYAHRLRPPLVAGYEGVGTVLASGNSGLATGMRVLPLRGEGTWQEVVTCPQEWAVPMPDDISDAVAARGYINPLAALLMLRGWPVQGREIILTAAGSDCARLLGAWARQEGAIRITGICRSPVHAERLEAGGIHPLLEEDRSAVITAARNADLVFDAVGGELASLLMAHMRPGRELVSYGLLSGRPATIPPEGGRPRRFHLREASAQMTPAQWQATFTEIWHRLRTVELSPLARFPLADWEMALGCFATQGRREKPALEF